MIGYLVLPTYLPPTRTKKDTWNLEDKLVHFYFILFIWRACTTKEGTGGGTNAGRDGNTVTSVERKRRSRPKGTKGCETKKKNKKALARWATTAMSTCARMRLGRPVAPKLRTVPPCSS